MSSTSEQTSPGTQTPGAEPVANAAGTGRSVLGTGRIVVGIDESTASVDALRWAVDEASRRGGTVEAVAVWEVQPLTVFGEPVPIGMKHGQPAQRLARLMQVLEWLQPERDGIEVSADTMEGEAGPCLVERSRDADLVVLGASRHARGSRTEQYVIRHARCPVILVPQRDEVLSGD